MEISLENLYVDIGASRVNTHDLPVYQNKKFVNQEQKPLFQV